MLFTNEVLLFTNACECKEALCMGEGTVLLACTSALRPRNLCHHCTGLPAIHAPHHTTHQGNSRKPSKCQYQAPPKPRRTLPCCTSLLMALAPRLPMPITLTSTSGGGGGGVRSVTVTRSGLLTAATPTAPRRRLPLPLPGARRPCCCHLLTQGRASAVAPLLPTAAARLPRDAAAAAAAHGRTAMLPAIQRYFARCWLLAT